MRLDIHAGRLEDGGDGFRREVHGMAPEGKTKGVKDGEGQSTTSG